MRLVSGWPLRGARLVVWSLAIALAVGGQSALAALPRSLSLPRVSLLSGRLGWPAGYVAGPGPLVAGVVACSALPVALAAFRRSGRLPLAGRLSRELLSLVVRGPLPVAAPRSRLSRRVSVSCMGSPGLRLAVGSPVSPLRLGSALGGLWLSPCVSSSPLLGLLSPGLAPVLALMYTLYMVGSFCLVARLWSGGNRLLTQSCQPRQVSPWGVAPPPLASHVHTR